MMRRILSALMLLALVSVHLAAQAAPTVIIVVRHAEKGTTPANDPPLTDAGTARARSLAAALAGANVQAVITTQLLRTKDTARPTAEARGLTTEIVPTTTPDHPKAVADAARKHVGQTVLVVGHSNTVAQIVASLGGPKAADLCDSEYSNIYTVILDGTSVRVVQSTFGAPSPEAKTGCPAGMK